MRRERTSVPVIHQLNAGRTCGYERFMLVGWKVTVGGAVALKCQSYINWWVTMNPDRLLLTG